MSQEKPDYQAVLKDLEEKRAQIEAAIMAIRAFLLGEKVEGIPPSASNGGSTLNTGTGEMTSDAFFGMAVNDAIKKYLRIRKRPQGVTEIMKALQEGGITTMSKNFYTTVYTALDRGEGEDFVKVKRGQWGLTEWYPGRVSRKSQTGDSED